MELKNSLYEKVIEKNFKEFNKLKIISGYASADFLEFVIKNSTIAMIDLYIGMSQEGISMKAHKKFQYLCKSNKYVNVYYQYTGRLTHIKLYVFYGIKSSKSYIGSANFSENGFIKNRELLVESGDDYTTSFNEQICNSIHCNDESVNDFINFFEEDINEKQCEFVEKNNAINELRRIISEFNYKYNLNNIEDSYRLPIVIDEKANKLWYQSGINGLFYNNQSYLIKPNLYSLKDYFPINQFKIIAYDGKEYSARLKGDFYRELHINGWNFYNELSKWLNLTQQRPINKADLIKLGFTHFCFVKKEENVYLMSLVNNI